MRESKPLSTKKKDANRLPIDRPFDPGVLETARAIVERYSIILEPAEHGGFVGHALEFPTGFITRPTADECISATREALAVAAATMLETGRQPPAPAVEGTRQAQMNIRLSAEEKLLLERSARQSGFRGVSDFVRHAALNRAMGLDVPLHGRGVGSRAKAKPVRGGRASKRPRSSTSRG